MLNVDDFINRLEKVLDYYGLSASGFADKIGVQRSNMSHLLSGRNKPSLDFILKITEMFPEVDLYWILNGKGQFPKNQTENRNVTNVNIKNLPLQYPSEPDLFTQIPSEQVQNNVSNQLDALAEETSIQVPTVNDTKLNPQLSTAPIVSDKTQNNPNRITERIVYFYNDGTFKEYKPLEES